jgi:hypothetical protein
MAEFFGLQFVGWGIVYLIHQSIGGLLGLFNRGIRKRHAIEIVNAKNKKS